MIKPLLRHVVEQVQVDQVGQEETAVKRMVGLVGQLTIRDADSYLSRSIKARPVDSRTKQPVSRERRGTRLAVASCFAFAYGRVC